MGTLSKISEQKFIPVILGGNLGAYSIARSFHEAYGIKSITISRLVTGSISNSMILHTVLEENMDKEEKLIQCLQNIDQKFSNIPKILLCSDDWHVELATGIKDRLGPNWIVPYASKELIQYATKKANFYKLCEETGVDFPQTVVYSSMEVEEIELPFSFPVVIKPTNSMTYSLLSFEGKKKVYIADTKEEFEQIIAAVRAGGYKEDLIIQEFIPGDDTSMHVLTCYTTKDGETVMASMGQTLVEDHTPTGAGNHLVIRTLEHSEVADKAARLIKRLGYVGFSNFDIKYDQRDGKYKFFELNARLGRSNYYVTAAGNNVAKYYVEDYLNHQKIPPSFMQNEVLYTVIPKRLLLKSIKNKELREMVKNMYRKKLVKHPLKYRPVEKNPKHRFYEIASTLKFYLKFKKYPPHPELAERM